MNEGKVNPQAIALRQTFEDWYTLNVFDFPAKPEAEGSYEGSPLHKITDLQNEVGRLDKLLAAAQEQKPVATPVAWIRGHEYLVDGEREYDEEVSAGASKPNGERWHPLFASPIPASGWVMVPREPTKEMLDAAQSCRLYTEEDGSDWRNSDATWRAMLAAVVVVETK